MKIIRTIQIVSSIMIPLLLLSCNAENDIPSEQNDSAKIEQLRKDILGKWVFGSKNLRTTNNNSFIEFLKDTTFVVSLGSEKMYSDKFTIVNTSEISLENFGKVENILFKDDEINFGLSYAGQKVVVNANKTVAFDDSAKTQLLSRGWEMTDQEDGKDTVANVGRSFITFSSSGTYKIEVHSEGGTRHVTGNYNWKWHSTISNRIVYWHDRGEIDEDNRYMIIRELTPTSLKTTESNFWGLRNYVFIPEK